MTVKKLEYNDNESRINNVNNSKTENKHYDANKTYILCRKAREKQHYSELIFDSAIVSESISFFGHVICTGIPIKFLVLKKQLFYGVSA